MNEIRNTCFWSYVPGFIQKKVVLTKENILIVGYFPHHVARIRQRLHRSYTLVPRSFLESFENILIKHHINDNKAVYICEVFDTNTCQQFHWAVMLKDDYAIIGSWEEVVTYDNKPLKIKSTK